VEDGVRTKGIDSIPSARRVLLLCATCLILAGVVAGCSDPTTQPTNSGPFSDLVQGDIPAAGITLLEAAEGPSEFSTKGQLYLKVEKTGVQDAGTIANRLVALVRKYTGSLHLHSLHVVITSTGGLYDRTYDFDSDSWTDTSQHAETPVPNIISEAKAISAAKDYVDLAYRQQASATMVRGSATTEWVPVKSTVLATELHQQTSVSGPPPHSGLAWSVEMTTDRTTLTWWVDVDAVTGEVLAGGFAFSD
jgi:hypothetical protein